MNTQAHTPTLCFVFGTRPEIIKLAPVIKECERRDVPFITVHTGQHYSENMDTIFWKGLELPPVDYNLSVGSGTHATQTARMLTAFEEVLMKEKPDAVVVQGDTNSVLAGALVACKLYIPIAHVEAGLRSYDRKMPEEINRVLVGAVSAHHFTPTEEAKRNLLREGVSAQFIHTVGNTIVDAVLQNVTIAEKQSRILETIFSTPTPYALVTVHRAENTDSEENLTQIIAAFEDVVSEHDLDLVWPIHPRTDKQLAHFGLTGRLKTSERIHIIEPVGFFDMLKLQKGGEIVITDSGGIQEEACILGVPCVTLRSNTERPESVEAGANLLAGNRRDKIRDAVHVMMHTPRDWQNPFGDGSSAEQIVDILQENLLKTDTEAPRESTALSDV